MKKESTTIMISLKKIKPKYIGVWLKDQLSRPDYFRNLFVDRSAWGAFSIYAHARRSDGKSKIAYSRPRRMGWSLSPRMSFSNGRR